MHLFNQFGWLKPLSPKDKLPSSNGQVAYYWTSAHQNILPRSEIPLAMQALSSELWVYSSL